MKHPFETDLSKLKQIDFDFLEDISDDELEKVHGGKSFTTLALGEEGGDVTTLALGEEGGDLPTTMALGEEGGHCYFK